MLLQTSVPLIEAVAQISTILGLLALGFLLYYFYRRAKLNRARDILKEINDSDRIEALKELGKSYGVPPDTLAQLTKQQIYAIVKAELDNKRFTIKKNQQTTLGIGVFALLAFAISAYKAINIDANQPSTIQCFKDTDGDGYGDPNNIFESAEACPEGYVSNGQDTDDSDPNRYLSDNVWYEDSDNDGFGNATSSMIAYKQPNGYVGNADDVDDNNKNRSLAALDKEWYKDEDQDGFGEIGHPRKSNKPIEGYVAKTGDLDDGDKNVFPGQTKFFSSPSKTKKIWDYNCDGKIENRFNQLGSCDNGRANPQGWLGSIPNCGQQGTWLLDCDRKFKGFPPKLEERKETQLRKQECR